MRPDSPFVQLIHSMLQYLIPRADPEWKGKVIRRSNRVSTTTASNSTKATHMGWVSKVVEDNTVNMKYSIVTQQTNLNYGRLLQKHL